MLSGQIIDIARRSIDRRRSTRRELPSPGAGSAGRPAAVGQYFQEKRRLRQHQPIDRQQFVPRRKLYFNGCQTFLTHVTTPPGTILCYRVRRRMKDSTLNELSFFANFCMFLRFFQPIPGQLVETVKTTGAWANSKATVRPIQPLRRLPFFRAAESRGDGRCRQHRQPGSQTIDSRNLLFGTIPHAHFCGQL